MTNNQKNEKAGRLLEALGDVPDEMLEKASPESKIKKRPVWAYAAAAAAVVAVGGITTAVLMTREPQSMISGSDASADSPVVSVTEDDSTPELPKVNAEISFGDMGYEVYSSLSDLEYQADLWKDTDVLNTLPVYKNKVWQNRDGITNVPFDSFRTELMEQLKSAAALLGAEISDSEIYDDGMTEEDIQSYLEDGTADVSDIFTEPTYIKADTDKFSIKTYREYETRIEFNTDAPPETKYHVSTYEEALQTAEGIKIEYADLLNGVGITDPVTVINCGTSPVNGEWKCYNIEFYNAGNSVGKNMENQAMKTVCFYGDNSHTLNGIVITRTDLRAEYLGDYQLMTLEEAAEQLMSGDYSTNYYSAPIDDDYRPTDYAEVVLDYRVDSHQEYILPYYRFFVDITDQLDNGSDSRSYGVFYVPAVRPEYLE